MNRTVPGQQSLRGLPNGFSNPAQVQQSRSPSSRLPNGKMPTNGTTWSAFGGGVPMGSVGLPSQRPSSGPMTSFAQTIAGSQPATPIDLSEFPSLSNNPQQSSSSTPSMWSNAGVRSIAQPSNQRPSQQSILLAHPQTQAQQQTQQQQDDLFSSSSQIPTTQAAFRFSGQSAVGPSQSSSADDFPPLSRNGNGEIGQDREAGMLPGFGQQSTTGFGGSLAAPGSEARNNGLLNALSSSTRNTTNPAQTSPPTSISGLTVSRSPVEASRSVAADSENGFTRSLDQTLQSSRPEAQPGLQRALTPPQTADFRLSSRQDVVDGSGPDVEDPLAGFSDKDRFGLKGLTAMLSSYPDQAALIGGLEISSVGFDLGSHERVTEMIWSPFDDIPARPPVPKYTLPDCYQVHNVQQIENKMSSFSDETLMYMFYSNPQDIQQIMAANELTTRNWRYHKKLQTWLTKDEMMVPQHLGQGTERGYYIFFDYKQWSKERRELVLNYADLEPVPSGPAAAMLQ